MSYAAKRPFPAEVLVSEPLSRFTAQRAALAKQSPVDCEHNEQSSSLAFELTLLAVCLQST